MQQLITMNNQDSEATMTLKEITDLLKVQHSKAMAKVLKMAEEEGFGSVAKMDIDINSGNGGQKITTLQLNKVQSIMAAAKLNDALLIKVVNRWAELEEKQQQPQLMDEEQMAVAYLANVREVKRLRAQALLNAPKVALMDAMEAEELAISIGDWAKLLSKTNELKIGPNKLMSFLREKGLLMKGRDANERNKPYQVLIEAGLFDMKLSSTPVGVKVQPLITTKGQTKYSEMVVDNFR